MDFRTRNITKTTEGLLFSEQQCAAVFSAVLADDDINLSAKLPEKIYFDYSQAQLTECYYLCRQLWQQDVDRKVLAAMINKIYHQQSFDEKDQLAFKYIRAKFKHLRYAFALYDQRHKYPSKFHIFTALMGSLQDAFKNQQIATMKRFALLLKFLLTPSIYAFIVKEVNQFTPTSITAFKQHENEQLNFLQVNLAKAEVTSKVFHKMRKVIGRQTAFYTTIKVLYPAEYHEQMFMYLSTINGMMGDLHDELVSKKFQKQQDYNRDTFIIPDEIKSRLVAYTALYFEN